MHFEDKAGHKPNGMYTDLLTNCDILNNNNMASSKPPPYKFYYTIWMLKSLLTHYETPMAALFQQVFVIFLVSKLANILWSTFQTAILQNSNYIGCGPVFQVYHMSSNVK
jgi:hypothetical protein